MTYLVRTKHNLAVLSLRRLDRSISRLRTVASIVDVAKDGDRGDVEDFVIEVDNPQGYIADGDIGHLERTKECTWSSLPSM